MKYTIIFTSLAQNQSEFLINVSKNLISMQHQPIIISFHENSMEKIENSGIKSYNVFKYIKSFNNYGEIFLIYKNKYNIDNAGLIFSHEREVYNINNPGILKKKLVQYISALEIIFEDIKNNQCNKLVVFQETGGFISLLSTFYLSQFNKIDHFFFEPSIFNGRIFLIKNSFQAPKINLLSSIDDKDAFKMVSDYIERISNSKNIVIPLKDILHYQNPVWKIINRHNIKRLFQKLFEKYFLNKKEEFSYIGNYIIKYINMLLKRLFFHFKYDFRIPDAPFVYYPFHVPEDMALTIRSPQFLDQYSLVDYISRIIPETHKLVVKEHPAREGALSLIRMIRILKRNNNIVFLHPKNNTYSIVQKMDLMITVNSKSGAEAMMVGRKVITLGDAFYKNSPVASHVGQLDKLGVEILKIINKKLHTDSEIKKYFYSVWKNTYEGEIYSINLTDSKIFADSLICGLRK